MPRHGIAAHGRVGPGKTRHGKARARMQRKMNVAARQSDLDRLLEAHKARCETPKTQRHRRRSASNIYYSFEQQLISPYDLCIEFAWLADRTLDRKSAKIAKRLLSTVLDDAFVDDF